MSVSTKQRMVGRAVASRIDPGDPTTGDPNAHDSEIPTSTDHEVPTRDPEQHRHSADSGVHRTEPEAERLEYHDTIPSPPPDDVDDEQL